MERRRLERRRRAGARRLRRPGRGRVRLGRPPGRRGATTRTGATSTAPAAAASPGLEKKDLDEQVVEQYFAAGERVLHATLGEGTVLAVEGGGIVLVRFENDGSERRLMASVAPLRKLALTLSWAGARAIDRPRAAAASVTAAQSLARAVRTPARRR